MLTQVLENIEYTDVVIVGAGPVGLAMGISLAQERTRFVLLDKLAQGQNTSRAGVIHAHTLEQLERLGVSQKLVQLGKPVARFSIRDRERTVLDIDFAGLPSAYPYALMLPQNDTEKVLESRLGELGARVHRGWTVEDVVDLGGRVRVTAVSETGGRRIIEALYVVGADGLHSVVRKAANIDFVGHHYEESFLLADVEMVWDHGNDEVKLFFSPAGMVVVAPLPDGSFRIVSTVQHAPAVPDVADVQAIMDARGPRQGKAMVKRVRWGSRFRVQHRIAETYRKGRLLLAGDAAHVHSPAGGQGMNTGIVDAVLLGRMLPEVIVGRRDDASLDAYGALRRPAAEKVLALSGRLTAMATVQSARRRAMRNALLSIVNRIGPVKRRIAMALSGIARRDAAQMAPMTLAVDGPAGNVGAAGTAAHA